MAIRFRKSIRLASGVKINVGKRGISTTFGGRGANLNVGKRGVHANVGIPGTGLSARNRIGGTATRKARYSNTGRGYQEMSIKLKLSENGKVEFSDNNDIPLPENLVKITRYQNEEGIRDWLHKQCDNWNQGIDKILEIHLETPPADRKITFEARPFDIPRPAPPLMKSLGLLGRIFESRKESIEKANQAAQERYKEEVRKWEQAKRDHEAKQAKRKTLLEVARLNDVSAMDQFLAEAFEKISWPRETLVSYQIDDNGKTVLLDVDLPEIEDMPTEQASVASRGLKINIKKKSQTHIQKEYMHHVHAVPFRLIGELFVALPGVKVVVISGFSQRRNKATGHISDEYLLSCKVTRNDWEKINFDNLRDIDLTKCLETFELRSNMTKTGVFFPIKPFESSLT